MPQTGTVGRLCRRFPERLRTMARIAPGSQVIERKPQIRANCDRNLMIHVQMPLIPREPVPQLGQHLVGRRRTQPEVAEVHHHVRFPAAIHAPPLVALEAKQPQRPVVGAVPAFRRRTSLLLLLPPMNRTVSRLAQGFAAWPLARLKRKRSHKALVFGLASRARPE
jgi:hypothetical protein